MLWCGNVDLWCFYEFRAVISNDILLSRDIKRRYDVTELSSLDKSIIEVKRLDSVVGHATISYSTKGDINIEMTPW